MLILLLSGEILKFSMQGSRIQTHSVEDLCDTGSSKMFLTKYQAIYQIVKLKKRKTSDRASTHAHILCIARHASIVRCLQVAHVDRPLNKGML